MSILLLLSTGLFAGKPKPDLQITKIDLTRDCRLAVTVRNNGPGKLPDEVYTNHQPKSASVQVTITSTQYGISFMKLIIWRADSARKLQPKGGKVTFSFSQKISSPVRIKAEVDLFDVVDEAKENNNILEREISECSSGPSIIRNNASSLVGPKNSFSYITFLPKSPSLLYPNQKVKIFIDYFTNEKQGVLISVKPRYRGSSIGCITPPSVQNPGGKGRCETYFTFGKGPVKVDEVLFQMSDVSSYKIIYEKIVKVKFDFRATHILAKPPQRVFLDFNNARLEYVTSSKRIRIRSGNIVLSRGKDWESVMVQPHLFHLRQKNWEGFFWMVDTKAKCITRNHADFGHLNALNNILIQGISVKVIGGGNTGPPQRFVLRFSKAYLEYTPSPGAARVITEDNVLSTGRDWRDCIMSANTFHIKKKDWHSFFWKIDTAEKKAYKITGGSFCTSSGSTSPLPVVVRIYN